MKHALKVIHTLTELGSGYLAALIVFLLMWLVLVEVASRYIAKSALGISDEYGSFAVVAISMLALAYSWKEKTHTRVEFLVSRLPEKVRNRIRLVTISIAVAFIPVLLGTSIQTVIHSYTEGVRSLSWLRTPLVWAQIPMIVGYFLLLLYGVSEIVQAVAAVKAHDKKNYES